MAKHCRRRTRKVNKRNENPDSKPKPTRTSADLLPPEIWLRVHRWATFVPNALDVDAPDPFSYPPPLKQTDIQGEIRRSLRTKRALVLVCKQWKELSLRFLYEAVYVGLTSTIWKLYLNVIGGKEGGITKEVLQWTKRLDFAIRDTSKKNVQEDSNFLKYALHLHVFMPNLEIFVARRTDPHTVFMQRLFSNICLGSSQNKVTVFDSTHRLYDCTESDSRFVWTTGLQLKYDFETWEESPSEDTNHWSAAFHQFHTMRHLHIQPNLISPELVSKIREATDPVRAPNLQYLVVTDWAPYRVNVENQDAPDLPFHFAYWGSIGGPSSNLSFTDYLTRSPGLPTRLTTFECGRTHDMDIPVFMDIVAEHCPNLQNVILTVPTWESLMYALPSTKLPKTVQRLGVRSFRKVGRRVLMRDLCDALCHVSETSTSLRVIRIMDLQTSRNLREVNLPIASQMKKRLDDRKILLEAFDGKLLL